jgi:gas vesicle protein
MKDNAKVFWGFVAGLAAGAVAGILLAPDSGKNTRKKVSDSTGKIKDDVQAQVQKGMEKINSLSESAFSLINKYGEEKTTNGNGKNAVGENQF